jgi:carbon monoxide dehydrogenase subunit G
MTIAGTQTVPALRDRVFAMLLDPAVLQRAIPGCEEIAPTEAGAFHIKMSAGIASIRGKVEGQIKIQESRAPEHYKLAMSGKGMGSFVEGWADIDLAEADGATEVKYAGEAKIGGMIAAVGNRMIDLAVKKALGDFFERLKQEAG